MRPPTSLPPALLAAALLASAVAPGSARAEPPSPAVVPVAITPRAPTAPPAEDDTRALRFAAGVSFTSIGLLSLVIGGVMAGRAAVARGDIGTHCNAAVRCDLTGYALGSEAVDFSSIATITVVAGLVVAAGGAGLLISSTPRKPRPTAWIAPTAGGLVLSGGARW